jgi:hypothetical protein
MTGLKHIEGSAAVYHEPDAHQFSRTAFLFKLQKEPLQSFCRGDYQEEIVGI